MFFVVLSGLAILASISWLAGGRLWRWLGPIWSFVVGFSIVRLVVSTADSHIDDRGIADAVGVLLGLGFAALACVFNGASLSILAGAVGFSLTLVAHSLMEPIVVPPWGIVGMGGVGAAIAAGLALMCRARTALAIVLTAGVGANVIFGCFAALVPDYSAILWRGGVIAALALGGTFGTVTVPLAGIGIAVQVLTSREYRTRLEDFFASQ